jgi:hypothetical protein
MSKVEKLRKKAEDAWTDCDSCNSNDKSMWINGYIVGALANPIELPTDEEINTYVKSTGYYGHCTPEYREGIEEGAKWMRDKIKGGNNE